MKKKAEILAIKDNLAKIAVNTYNLKVGDRITVIKGEDRSNEQNKLYWKMLEIVQDETGHSKEELHEFFKQEFLGDKIEVLDKPFIYSRSTTKLKTDEFGKYLSDIRYYVLDKLEFDLPIE